MIKRVIAFLLCMVLFFTISCPSMASAAQADRQKYYDYKGYEEASFKYAKNFLGEKGYWKAYFADPECHVETLFKDSLDGTFSDAGIRTSAMLMNGVSIFDLNEDELENLEMQYYEMALLSLFSTMEDDIMTDPAHQKNADKTKKWHDYLWEGANALFESTSDYFSVNGESKLADLASRVAGLGDICVDTLVPLLQVQDGLDAYQLYASDVQRLETYVKMLNIFEKSDNKAFSKAASDIKQILVFGVSQRWTDISVNGLDSVRSNMIDDLCEQLTKTDSKLLTLIGKGEGLYSGVRSFLNLFNDGITLGAFAMDVGIKSSDMILRYYELCAMAYAYEAILADCSNLVDKGMNAFEDILALREYLYELLYIDARGNYCAYILQKTGWLSIFCTREDEKYDILCKNLMYIKEVVVDFLIPDLENYELTYEEWMEVCNSENSEDILKRYAGKSLYIPISNTGLWELVVYSDCSGFELYKFGFWKDSEKNDAYYCFDLNPGQVEYTEIYGEELRIKAAFTENTVTITPINTNNFGELVFRITNTTRPKPNSPGNDAVAVNGSAISQDKIVGEWKVDEEYTRNHSKMTIRDMYGSQYNTFSPYMILGSDSSAEFYVGFVGGKGTYTILGDGVVLDYDDYNAGHATSTLKAEIDGGVLRLKDTIDASMGGYTYWVRTGGSTVHNVDFTGKWSVPGSDDPSSPDFLCMAEKCDAEFKKDGTVSVLYSGPKVSLNGTYMVTGNTVSCKMTAGDFVDVEKGVIHRNNLDIRLNGVLIDGMMTLSGYDGEYVLEAE